MKVQRGLMLATSIVACALLQTEGLHSQTFIWANRSNGPFPISPIVCPLPGYPTCGSVTKLAANAIIYADGGGNVASYLNPIHPSDAPILKLVEGDTPNGQNGLWELDYDLYNRTANVSSGSGDYGTVYIKLLDALGVQFWQLSVTFDRSKGCERGPQQGPGGYIPNNIVRQAVQYTIGQDQLTVQIKPC